MSPEHVTLDLCMESFIIFSLFNFIKVTFSTLVESFVSSGYLDCTRSILPVQEKVLTHSNSAICMGDLLIKLFQ